MVRTYGEDLGRGSLKADSNCRPTASKKMGIPILQGAEFFL
jgi:hypothetical protein